MTKRSRRHKSQKQTKEEIKNISKSFSKIYKKEFEKLEDTIILFNNNFSKVQDILEELKKEEVKSRRNYIAKKRFERKFRSSQNEVSQLINEVLSTFSKRGHAIFYSTYANEIFAIEEKRPILLMLEELINRVELISNLGLYATGEIDDMYYYISMMSRLMEIVSNEIIAYDTIHETLKDTVVAKLELHDEDSDEKTVESIKISDILSYDFLTETFFDVEEYNETIREVVKVANNSNLVKAIEKNYLEFVQSRVFTIHVENFKELIDYYTGLDTDILYKFNELLEKNKSTYMDFLNSNYLTREGLIQTIGVFTERTYLKDSKDSDYKEVLELVCEKNIHSKIKEFFSYFGTDIVNELENIYNSEMIIIDPNGHGVFINQGDSQQIVVSGANSYPDMEILCHELTHALEYKLIPRAHPRDLTLHEVKANVTEWLLSSYIISKNCKNKRHIVNLILVDRHMKLHTLLYNSKIYGNFELDVWNTLYQIDLEAGNSKLIDMDKKVDVKVNEIYKENVEKIYTTDELELLNVSWALQETVLSEPLYMFKYSLSAYIAFYLINRIENEEGFLDKYIKAAFSSNSSTNWIGFLKDFDIDVNDLFDTNSNLVFDYILKDQKKMEDYIIRELPIDVFDISCRKKVTI